MPNFSIIRRDLAFAGTVKDTKASSPKYLWTAANKIANPAPVEPLLAETFVNTDAGGAVAGEAETLAAIKETKFEGGLEDVKVMTYGTTAVVTGTTNARGTANGKPSEVHLRWTSVWVKMKDENWQSQDISQP